MKSSQAYQADCAEKCHRQSYSTRVWIAAFAPLSLQDAYMDAG